MEVEDARVRHCLKIDAGGDMTCGECKELWPCATRVLQEAEKKFPFTMNVSAEEPEKTIKFHTDKMAGGHGGFIIGAIWGANQARGK